MPTWSCGISIGEIYEWFHSDSLRMKLPNITTPDF